MKPDRSPTYGNRKLEQSLPNAEFTATIDDLKAPTSFREKTKMFYGEEFESRICRVMVMERLYPIFRVEQLEQFKEAFRQIVLGEFSGFSKDFRV